MRVITIEEDNHGLVGIAKDYKSAVQFLVDNDWLSELTEIPIDEYGNFHSIKEHLGENWLAVVLKWKRTKFNEFFEGCFYLTVEKVYGVD